MAAAASTTPGSTTFPTSTRRGRPAPHFDYRLGIDPDNPFTTLGINIQAAADISDESNGWLVQPSLDYINRLSLQWLFNARLFSTYADENYMQEYLDVSGNQGDFHYQWSSRWKHPLSSSCVNSRRIRTT